MLPPLPRWRAMPAQRERDALQWKIEGDGALLNSGQNSVFYALEDSDLEILEMLIKRGADINKRMDDGWTPLLSAVSAGQYGTAALLLRNGADKSARTEAGWDMYPYDSSVSRHSFAQLLVGA